jgi:hypothetical protein
MHYHEQNKAILSVHHQRRHTGAVPKLDRFSYIPHESPPHQPHSGDENQMDVDPATPPRRLADDRARPETNESHQQRRPILECLGPPVRQRHPSSSTSSSSSDSDSPSARPKHQK